eukprot:PhM_4_TR7039/c0_g1_i1/m.24464/K01001/ALG7; UDP-N-acetylglucosamine--dolichyl-phosphate N-acetylglucosaminephosphotransferase
MILSLNVFLSLVATSALAYWLALAGIDRVRGVLKNRGIFGIDINKITDEQLNEFRALRALSSVAVVVKDERFKRHIVPESAGIVVGFCYLSAVLLCMLLCQVPLGEFNAALCSIVLILLLGFVDDVLDVRWRYKIVLSLLATIPLVISYNGGTSVMLPIPLRGYGLSNVLDLGPLYLVAMSLVCVFCTNSINILAGINGLEAGQSLVIGISIMLHNLLQIHHGFDVKQHEVSLILIAPFVTSTIALMRFNAYPSRVFVGDSFTYFAGMVLAVTSITGHFTKTLLLFFIPQLLNFVMSLPQLFGIVPCPRHRVPKWDSKRDVLVNSKNYTLLNAALYVFGDMHERKLANLLIGFQVVCCALGFVVRYFCAGIVFEVVM